MVSDTNSCNNNNNNSNIIPAAAAAAEGGNNKKRVCVIGAGPSGLVASRELRKEGHNVVVLEQNRDIGGQWLYDDHRPAAAEEVHSSIYDSLRLISPRETMGFTDFPFVQKKGRDMRRFPGHRELFSYLEDFVDWFELRDMIRFNTKVEYVGMLMNSSSSSSSNGNYNNNNEDLIMKWVVKSKYLGRAAEAETVVDDVFDAVVVATGHYSQPRLPTIKGMDVWKRKQMHSHIYRIPEPFRNQVVVVIGNSFSGEDISLELLNVAKEIHISSRNMIISEGLSKVISKYSSLHLHPQIESLHEDGRVQFIDGSCIIGDSILYCTGYSYSLPFLDTKGIVSIDDDRVGPLYEHTFPPSLAPSLSFIGIPRKLIGFPFFESQAKWIAQLLSGKRTLPSPEKMMKSVHEFYISRDIAGIPKHNTHDIADFEYCDRYGDYVEFPHLEEWRKELCLSALRNAEINLENFRDSYDENDEHMLQIAYQSSHFMTFPSHAQNFN